MSRLSANFSKHKKDNYSLDIKGIYKTGMVHTPFVKSKDSHSQFFTKLRPAATHNFSMQLNENENGARQKRRFSLTKTHKMNHSVGIESHLSKQKIKKVNQLLVQAKYEQCLALIKQMLTREQNLYNKNRLFWLNATCLLKIGKYKESEHYLTRLLNEQNDNYQALIERAKVRRILGAKELGIRDLKHAVFINSKDCRAHQELCQAYIEDGNYSQAFEVANSAIDKGVCSIELLLIVIEILIDKNMLVSPNSKRWQVYIKEARNQIGYNCKQSADYLYLEALVLQSEEKLAEACIFYEQCLKFNNSRNSVTKSLQRLISIKINQRDYYSAYHTVNRYKILSIDTKLIQPYVLFLEGVILIMKKKFELGIKLFDTIIDACEGTIIPERSEIYLANQLNLLMKNKAKKDKAVSPLKISHKCKTLIMPLLLKFNAYASFKIGHHQRSIQYYEKLKIWGLDECSSYNLLLAQGIIAVQRRKNFQLGMEKFQQARYVYPCKVEPSIYVAMTVIYRDLCISGASNNNVRSESLTSAVIHAMQQLNEAFETVNSVSSNLLYHRCILNLYMEEWDSAINDINLCIQKAEENEPKYFYLRGLCYAVVKDLKKAINEYSISLSLNSQFDKSLLERSKCYFLLGETEAGFIDLKQYMLRNQSDYYVHKWIGDLLYEGKSYSDALKAYSEIDESLSFETEIMKCKCLIRVSDLNKVGDCLTKLTKLEDCNQAMIQVDILAVNLLKILVRSHEQKQLISKIKKLNTLLEANCVGYIFELIDCMNLLGVATFVAGKFQDAYESYLLVLQLFSTLAQKNKSQLKSDSFEEGLSLCLQDIYVNITSCLIGIKNYEPATQIMQGQLLGCTSTQESRKNIMFILDRIKNKQNSFQTFHLEPDFRKNQKLKFKQISLKFYNLKIKCSPVFSLFHTCVEDLYSKSVTQKIIRDLKPSYIDNMPQGPWIKRNEHGVIFTDNVIDDESSFDFLSSMRAKQSQQVSQQPSRVSRDGPHFQQLKREDFKKKMMLDKELQKKLNKIIQKSTV